MGHIYAVVNQKGGVGKTTTSVNLAAYLAAAGKRVLVVDLDSQGNATSHLGIDRDAVQTSAYDVLLEKTSAEACILYNERTKIAIIPSVPALAAAEVELVSVFDRERRLKAAIATVSDNYDYVLFDCPPSLGLVTVNALTAANGVLIPVQTEYLPLEGLGSLVRTYELVKQRLNPDLEIRGLIMTMYDPRTALANQVVAEVEKHFGKKVFTTRIPRSVRLSEAPSYGQPITTYAPNSPGAQAYGALVSELIAQDDGVRKPARASKKQTA
jgi:chromosome partitioning protein